MDRTECGDSFGSHARQGQGTTLVGSHPGGSSMVLKAPDSPPAIATVALPVPGPSLCCCPTCRSLPKGASLSPTPSSVFPVPSPWHFHSWGEEAEQGENGTCSPRGAQFQPAAHSVRCSGTHVPRQLPGFPLLPPSLLPSGKPSSTAGAEQGGATNGYSWARKGTHGLPPASCALVPGVPTPLRAQTQLSRFVARPAGRPSTRAPWRGALGSGGLPRAGRGWHCRCSCSCCRCPPERGTSKWRVPATTRWAAPLACSWGCAAHPICGAARCARPPAP